MYDEARRSSEHRVAPQSHGELMVRDRYHSAGRQGTRGGEHRPPRAEVGGTNQQESAQVGATPPPRRAEPADVRQARPSTPEPSARGHVPSRKGGDVRAGAGWGLQERLLGRGEQAGGGAEGPTSRAEVGGTGRGHPAQSEI